MISFVGVTAYLCILYILMGIQKNKKKKQTQQVHMRFQSSFYKNTIYKQKLLKNWLFLWCKIN